MLNGRLNSGLSLWKGLLLPAVVVFGIVGPTAMAQVSARQPAARAAGKANGSAKPLSFDVISIRPSKPGSSQGMQLDSSRNGYWAQHQSMWTTLMLAYNSKSYQYWDNKQLLGVPSWAIHDLYDIDARVSAKDLEAWQKQGPQHEMLQSMLQDALKERCKLVIHRTSTEKTVFALVVGKHGAKLKLSKPGAPPPPHSVSIDQAKDGRYVYIGNDRNPTGFRFYATSMESLATYLSGHSRRAVVDKTGLTGEYDFELRRNDDSASASDPDPSSDLYLVDVGLALKPTKQSTDVFVIDHIERPSAN